MLRNLFKTSCVALSLLLPLTATHAEGIKQDEVCVVFDYSNTTSLPWFLGFYASDDLMTAWCRIQQLPGNVRFNVWFPHTNVHKSWDTNFDGQTLPAERIVELVQGLLPQSDGPVLDEDGMAFARVLGNVVQAAAENTPGPDIRKLGFAANHPAAKELILWEPIVLRVRPVALMGQNFTLTVTLRPNIGAFAMGMQGRATDIQFYGARKRLPGTGIMSDCSDQIPYCEHLADVDRATIHAPWIVTRVHLEANGENMTETAVNLFNSLQARFGSSGGSSINRTTGEGDMTLSDGRADLVFRAYGGAGGTNRITMTYEEANKKNSVASYFAEQAEEYRILKQIPDEPKVLNPDSSGLLFGN
ncbi:hypothetical protein [Roseibium sp. RKSG952]|uniref:hypothetical protein n=1 Tax=Roseibium sp. RKSG952 TaxID=2529384 RepID=UPI0012BC59EC|nr:hypothetical protein [Roseibium sp. RKSG952]MTH96003.1 hypothetical protein [Roseibium sp. RKSG952]